MNAIAVVDRNWALGREGALLFNLPTDMRRFKELTTGGILLMGRKTLNSFEEGHFLPERRNIVITRNKDLVPPGGETVATPQEALALIAKEDSGKAWVIGGGSVYAALLSQCERTYLTKVDTVAEGEPDTYFPDLDHLTGWELEEESNPVWENNLSYRFLVYVNRNLNPDA